MSLVKLQWQTPDPIVLVVTYDKWKVYRSPTISGTYAEITIAATRPQIYSTIMTYLYDDPVGPLTSYYKVAAYNSVTHAEATPSAAFQGKADGYCTIQDIRDEGYPSTRVTDAQVTRGIAMATATIDRVCRQWFEPRVKTFKLDGRNGQDFHLEVPIIAITDVEVWESEVETDDLFIYNRHLTEGLTAPDDRVNPRISWKTDDVWSQLYAVYGSQQFDRGHRNIAVTGVFGYTELGRGEAAAETYPDSQVPVSFGQTPELIRRAAILLTIQFMFPIASGDGGAFATRGRITGESTRDQSYTMSTPNADDTAYGLTGSVEVDNLLMNFMPPISMGCP